jgi:uncharacterized protein YeaO (DUF488 family)
MSFAWVSNRHMIHIVRFFSRRLPNEGPRFGTVRRPPRGVPKADYTKLNIYDVWFPNLAPSAELFASVNDEGISWERWRKKFIAEMRQPEPSRVLDVFAKLSHQTNFAIGCYCQHEERCHRSILRELLKQRGAKLSHRPKD